MSKRVLKRLPPSICKAAEKLQNESLRCPVDNISVAEMTRIMAELLRTGKSNKEIIALELPLTREVIAQAMQHANRNMVGVRSLTP